MTLEQIKKEVERKFDNANVQPYDCEWSQGYECGKESAYSDCLELLNEYNPWHEYPREKPTEDGYYQVTFDDSTVDLARWKDGSWTFNPKIIAWKEMDKPYKKEEV